MDKHILGNKIAELRKEKGLTQKELAEELHVTDKAVSKWETGTNFPDLVIMEPLAAALGVGVSELLDLKGMPEDEIVERVARISEEKKNEIKKNIRFRSILIIVVGLLVMAAQFTASWEFHKLGVSGGIYGICTTGMTGITGCLIGSALYTLIHVRKL